MVGEKGLFVLKDKAVAISNYDSKVKSWFKKKKIHYMAVLPEVNKGSKNPSYMEYSIFYKKSYENAFKNYKKHFRNQVRQGRKHTYMVEMVRKCDEQLLDKVYLIYVKQMRRHNSFILPKSFFEEFIALPSSLLLLIKNKKDIMAYLFCIEYKDNLHASFGGGNPDYFECRCANLLYDELIKYACKKRLDIHFGIGEINSGYNRFKEEAGAVNYKCERFPDDSVKLKLAVLLSKCKFVGLVWHLLSIMFPKKLVYTIMPFT